jgi:hypothetical protein
MRAASFTIMTEGQHVKVYLVLTKVEQIGMSALHYVEQQGMSAFNYVEHQGMSALIYVEHHGMSALNDVEHHGMSALHYVEHQIISCIPSNFVKTLLKIRILKSKLMKILHMKFQ